MRYMGLDISSSTIGLAILDKDKKVVLKHLEHFCPPKEGHIFERVAAARSYLQSKLIEFQPDQVIIEDILLGHGKTNIKTLILLAIFNRGLGLVIFDHTKQEPIYLPPISVRHALKTDKVLPKKEEMPDLCAKILGIKFPFEYNKKGKIESYNYDRADAISVVLGYLKKQEQPIKIKKNKKRVKK